MKPIPPLPSIRELCEGLNAPDALTSVIRGHQAIDTALTNALSEALPEPHALELVQLKFGLKVDLALAIRLLRSESRPLFQKLNQIRNRFAHSPNMQFTESDARDLNNCLSKRQREMLLSGASPLSPLGNLRECMALAFVEASKALFGLRAARVQEEATSETIRDLLAGVDIGRDFDAEVARRLAGKKVEEWPE